MRTIFSWLFLGFFCSCVVAGLEGCAKVPMESIAVNEQVTAGIGSMEANSHRLIDGWRKITIEVLESRFDDNYEQAEKSYRQRNDVPAEETLSPDQVSEGHQGSSRGQR